MPRTEYDLPTVAPQARAPVGRNTYVQSYPDPNAGNGLMELGQALGQLGAKLGQKAKTDQASKDEEYKNNLDFYASQFAADKGNGLVDATQVGKAMPGASPIVVGRVTEKIGANGGEEWARGQLQSFMSDASNASDYGKQAAFFQSLRQQAAQHVQGNPFYGQGYVGAVNSVINEFQGNLQSQSAKYQQDVQEEDYTSQTTGALLGQPVTFQPDLAGNSTLPPLDPSKTPGKLMDIIGKHEAGGNYNAYSGHADNRTVPVTNMTIDDVMEYQRRLIASGKTPSSAMGKYQIILPTMRDLVKDMGLTGNEKFTPAMQDQMAMALLNRRGYQDFKAGKISAAEFQDNLAHEWASLPLASGAGVYAGQNPTASSSELQAAMGETGASQNAAEAVDQTFQSTSSINPIRRRELTVNTAIQLAQANRDTSILDRIPSYMLTVPDVAKRVADARRGISQLTVQDFDNQVKLDAYNKKQAQNQAELDFLQKKANGDPVNAQDYINDPELYTFVQSHWNDDFTDPVTSSQNKNHLIDVMMSLGNNGNAKNPDGSPVDIPGDSTVDKISYLIKNAPGLSSKDRLDMMSHAQDYADGFDSTTDRMTEARYNAYVGARITGLMNTQDARFAARFNDLNLQEGARQAFDDVVTASVAESLGAGHGVPRGKDKQEILDQAVAAANAYIDSMMASATGGPVQLPPSLDNTKAKPPATQMPASAPATSAPTPTAAPAQATPDDVLAAKVRSGKASSDELLLYYSKGKQ